MVTASVVCLPLASCCCGCSLRTGTKIISVLEMVFSMLWILLASIALLYGDDAEERYYHQQDTTGPIILLTTSIIQFIFSVVLLHGVNDLKSGCFLAWLIYQTILILVYVFVGATVLAGGVIDHQYNLAVFLLLYIVVIILVRWYYASVVHSLYREVRQTPRIEISGQSGFKYVRQY